MNLPYLIYRREILGSAVPATPGLNWIRLINILPSDRMDEVFLGFTADGRFLVSYNIQLSYVILRFWLIPGKLSGPSNWLRLPFAELTLEKCPLNSLFSNAFGIRFLQSANDPQTFALLYTVSSGDAVSIIWGTLPEPNCIVCQNVLSSTPRGSKKCSKHLQLLRFCPDYQSLNIKCNNHSYNDSMDDAHRRLPNGDGGIPIPVCFSHYFPWLRYAQKPEVSSCICLENLTGGFHPSVCPETGRLRIAWVSQGQQIRVLSCSFGSEMACTMPMGAYLDPMKGRSQVSPQPPFAYMPPLLTSNYCSDCFFWPPDASKCHQQSRNMTSSFVEKCSVNNCLDQANHCVLSSHSIRLVRPDESWPDGHRHPILPKSSFLKDHECVLHNRSWNTWKPSLLSSRKQFYSCGPLSYLAMMQDIRASYMQWTLIPHCDSQSHADADINPEKLLANQLCGQCHSYFDAVEWRPYQTKQHSRDPDAFVVAHTEEVVFDLPEIDEGVDNQIDRILYTSPLEPNWIVVYDIDHCSSPPKCSFTTIIDISTGRQRDPDEAVNADRLTAITKHCPSHSRYSGVVSNRRFRLPMIAASSPLSRVPFQQSLLTWNTTLLELNNFSLTSAQKSLTRLSDPQGGYGFYL